MFSLAAVIQVFVFFNFLFQYSVCNQTGIPHLDLFPLNNATLEVDIYKGVRFYHYYSTVLIEGEVKCRKVTFST